jgi:hypothetical protein
LAGRKVERDLPGWKITQILDELTAARKRQRSSAG